MDIIDLNDISRLFKAKVNHTWRIVPEGERKVRFTTDHIVYATSEFVAEANVLRHVENMYSSGKQSFKAELKEIVEIKDNE